MNSTSEVNILSEPNQNIDCENNIDSNNNNNIDDENTDLLLARINLLIKQTIFHFSLRSFTTVFGLQTITKSYPLIELSDRILTILAKQISLEIKKWTTNDFNRLIQAIEITYNAFPKISNINFRMKPIDFFSNIFQFNDNDKNIDNNELNSLAAFLTNEAKNLRKNSIDNSAPKWINTVLDEKLIDSSNFGDLIFDSELFKMQYENNLNKKEPNAETNVHKKEENVSGAPKIETAQQETETKKKDIVLVKTITKPSALKKMNDVHQNSSFLTKIHMKISV